MLKEYILFFRKKYYIVLLLALIYIIFSATMIYTEGDFNNLSNVALDSSFDDVIKPYSTMEEVLGRIESLESMKSAIITNDDPDVQDELKSIEYYLALYRGIYDNNIAYDSTMSLGTSYWSIKHNQFSMFGSYANTLGIFIILVSCVIASIAATSHFTNRTSKILFSNGVTRTRTMFYKYLSSLSIITITVLLYDFVFSMFALIYAKNGVTTTYLVCNGKAIIINYLSYVLLFIVNHLIFLITIYTLIYYFSIITKNSIIALSVNMTLLVVSLALNINYQNEVLFTLSEMAKYGPIGALNSLAPLSMFDLSKLLWFLIFIALSGISVVVGNIALKRFDCSK